MLTVFGINDQYSLFNSAHFEVCRAEINAIFTELCLVGLMMSYCARLLVSGYPMSSDVSLEKRLLTLDILKRFDKQTSKQIAVQMKFGQQEVHLITKGFELYFQYIIPRVYSLPYPLCR